MENKYRILIVHNYYQYPGGEGTVVENEKQMLEKNGHFVCLYSKNNSEIKNYNLFKKILLPINYLFNIKTYFDIKRIIKKYDIDIVHIHNTINIISKSVYFVAKKNNIPIVQTIHNFRFLCPNGLLYRDGKICEECLKDGLHCAMKHKCYRNSFLESLLSVVNIKQLLNSKVLNSINYICFSEFNKSKLLLLNEIYGKEIINSNKVYIKPNYTITYKGKVNLNEIRNNVFIYASRLDEGKGIKDLLYAWKDVKRDSTLLICGNGPEEKWCKDYVNKNRINNIKFLGNISHDDLMKLISQSMCLLYPTKYYETFGLSIVEAYSVGTPSIVADFGNAGSLVEDKMTGYKYKYGDIMDLRKKIDSFVESKEMYSNCYQQYKEKYTETINYEKLLEIYNNVINDK